MTDGPVVRLSGEGRFHTGAEISGDAFPGEVTEVFVAPGFSFPDVLTAGALAGAGGSTALAVPSGV